MSLEEGEVIMEIKKKKTLIGRRSLPAVIAQASLTVYLYFAIQLFTLEDIYQSLNLSVFCQRDGWWVD